MSDGYNDHLPGMAAIRERNRLKRVVAWYEREARKRRLRAIRERDTETFVRERLSGSLRVDDPTVRRAMEGW